MKKGNLIYLVGAIIMFIIIMIPYFQNAVTNQQVSFFIVRSSLLDMYLWIVFFGMILGVMILLYIESVFNDIKSQDPEKFELN